MLELVAPSFVLVHLPTENRIGPNRKVNFMYSPKPLSREIFWKLKNRRKIYSLAEKLLTIILRLAAEKLYRLTSQLLRQELLATALALLGSACHWKCVTVICNKTVINIIKVNKSVIINKLKRIKGK